MTAKAGFFHAYIEEVFEETMIMEKIIVIKRPRIEIFDWSLSNATILSPVHYCKPSENKS